MASVPPPARGKDNVQSQGLVSGDLHQLQHGKAPPSGSFDTEASNFDGDTAVERRERHKWIPEDDILLISSWLNTSKDVMVGNEQRSDAFWSRIAAYFDARRESEATGGGCEQREPHHCKQRWHRINDLVSKFCGVYEAATKEKRSGQNDNDVLKLAHQIFYHNHHKKFTLEHAWKELRNDQKWCNLATAKHLSSKKRKCEDAANASSKKKVAEENSLNGFQSMWTIKQQDLLIKERLSKMSLLDSLLGKKEPLAEHEEALKKKLIDDLISS
ncbi:glutathione S-transferase T2-like [Brassica napus]|uniref:glutathione S-transferase T2-like n=1 Tax=Brassica napus TaxID=3708 RepID=UPI0006AAD575|nr:glutathione S-transferase T2-like [Brassica napus]